MATILNVTGENETLMQWVRDHGQDPRNLSCRVDLNDDGSVTLYPFVLDADGDWIIVESDVCQTCGRGSGERERSTEPVTVVPTRPFPIPAEVA